MRGASKEARLTMPCALRCGTACLIAAAAALLFLTAKAQASGIDGQCPAVQDKPQAIAHENYDQVQHITYCYGPISIKPGQNVIRLNATDLFPHATGYITRFDPEFIYADGRVPPVDVLHLHHAVWLHGLSPQFAVGEEKTIQQLPHGFGWPTASSDSWILNDMLHDLVAQPASVYVVWKIDWVPQASSDYASILPVHTQWMDVAGQPSLYPIFDALRADGHNGRYTFPDQAPPEDLHPCTISGRALEAHGCLGAAQTWTANQTVTLIGTAGHLHPGGLNTELTASRGAQTNSLFTSRAHYYEPAGEVSWDVSMGATPANWKVQLNPGDKLSVHTTYDTSRADWYEVMGIMPVAVYNGTVPGSVDAMSPSIPQNGVLTHGHLSENDNHGGDVSAGMPDPLALPGKPARSAGVQIKKFSYLARLGSGWSVPTIAPGQTLKFDNSDAEPAVNAFHTITACKAPCNAKTGVAYPIANGPISFDSGELGFNGNGEAAPKALVAGPAADRATWATPANLPAGTYTYFCRIHPFMRGSFRIQRKSPCAGKKPTLIGTPGNDVLRGTNGRDVIVGLGGRDKIIGRGGKDFLCGGGGKDKLLGGKGRDKLYGGRGRDVLIGGPGKDKMEGGKGSNRLRQ